MYGAQVASKDAITAWGAKVNQLIIAGQWWRLVTPAFFHGNIMHLVVNCYSLYNIAPALEGLCGGKRLIVTYLAAAVAGNVASFYGSAAPSLGASGAVFGLGGALAMYFYRNKELYGKRSDFILKQLWQTLLLNMAYGFANPRIDNW
jgi:uridine nucleosidase